MVLDLVIKGAVVGILVIAVGILARNSESSVAAILIHVPVFSLGAFWVASSISRESAKDVSGDALLAAPVWFAWVLTSYLLFRFTSLETWGVLLLGLLVWVIGALIYLVLAR